MSFSSKIRSMDYEGETVFTMTRKEPNRRFFQEPSSIMNEPDPMPEGNSNVTLCILWKNGKMGAAYYNHDDQQLYVLNDIVDALPQFCFTKSLLQQVTPKYVLTMGSTSDAFVKSVIDFWTNQGTSENSEEKKGLPADMSLLPFKEYSFEACRTILSTYLTQMLSIPQTANLSEKEIYLHSLIDFESRVSVYAIGALLKFLTKHWNQFVDGNEEFQILDINHISLADHIFIDVNSFDALQIFKTRSHEARFKHGASSSNREGLSIYKLFSTFCKSNVGQTTLRNVLRCPTRNMAELNKRLDFVEFAMKLENKPLIDNIQDDLKDIVNITGFLSRMHYMRANVKDWKKLYKVICNIIHIHEICRVYSDSVVYFAELAEAMTPELYLLVNSISNAIDFNNSKKSRPTIKFGLDDELDAKKLRRQNIGEHVTAASNFMIDRLPSYLNECTVIYIPEMGHIIVLKEWEPNCDRNKLEEIGFKFLFEVNGTLHYKNHVCVELDKQLGNIHVDIISHENRIIKRLSDIVIEHNRKIRSPLKIITMFDCLIAFSKAAIENEYVRPILNDRNFLEITEGRHPLVELIVPFQSNNFRSEANIGKVKIVTGPNASGKTVYVKQVAITVFLAHIGCFVPAEAANICMIDAIHTRLLSNESAAVNLSSFMVELSQVTQALHSATAKSLVLMDEFGRGTVENEGMGLLIGILNNFLKNPETCPNILISTHFDEVCRQLPESPLVEYLKLEHVTEGSHFSFLYRAVNGISSSHAIDVAASLGLDEDVVARAREILHCLQNNLPIQPVEDNLPQRFRNATASDAPITVRVPKLDE